MKTGHIEQQAVIGAGKKGGEYLDSIGVYDLSKLTKEQYIAFCTIICKTFDELNPPF